MYEVNQSQKTIRRLNGTSASDRIEAGRKFKSISDVKLGESVAIEWGDDTPLLDGSPSDATPMTFTSPVVEVLR